MDYWAPPVESEAFSGMDDRSPLLINFGYNPWSPFWKRNQTITFLMVKRGLVQNALFVSREIWIRNLLRHPGAYFRPPQRYYLDTIVPRTLSPGIRVFTPVVAGWRDTPLVLNRPLRPLIRRPPSAAAVRPAVICVNQLSPFVDEFLARLPVRPVIRLFDFSDDFSQFSTDPAEQESVRQRCLSEIRRADLVLCANETLRRQSLEVNPSSVVLRNATNIPTFADAPLHPSDAARFATLPRPVIGYMGWLNSLRLDIALIRFLAESRPAWSFVFLGPRSEPHPLGREIPRLPNVHVWEPVPFPRLPACLAHFDAAILPNLINPHTRGNDPIKLYDYLAMGRPVVATKTAGTEQLASHLFLADTPPDFLRSIEQALVHDDQESREARIAAARAHSWERRMDELEALLRPKLERIDAETK